MEPRNRDRLAGLLTSAPLVISLLLLVVNDWCLKAAWGNWFTGKLSDFAGIFLLALLTFALLPRRRMLVAVGICVAFAWWKSPLSQPVINAINSIGLPRIGRVVDYTDLVALVVVPAAWLTVVRRERRPRPLRALRRLLAPPMFVACLAAMVATTPAKRTEVFEIRELNKQAVAATSPASEIEVIEFREAGTPATLDPVKADETLKIIFGELGMYPDQYLRQEKHVIYTGGSTYITYVFLDDARIRFHVDYQPNQGRGFAGGYPGTDVREIRKALITSLDEILGDIKLREFGDAYGSYKPPSDSLQAKYVQGIFDEIAKKNGLRKASFGRYERDNSHWGLMFWFRDEVTLEYAFQDEVAKYVAGTSDDRKVENDIAEALNERFSGLQFYQFDRSNNFVDFEKASVIPAAE